MLRYAPLLFATIFNPSGDRAVIKTNKSLTVQGAFTVRLKSA